MNALDTIDTKRPIPLEIEPVASAINQGKTVGQIATQFNQKHPNVSRFIKRHSDIFRKLCNPETNLISLRLKRILFMYLDDQEAYLTDTELRQKTPQQVKNVGLGIIYDKLRLEEGKSTQNISQDHIVSSREDLKTAREATLARLKEISG